MDKFEVAAEIVQKLAEQGFTAYFAGGWVRDYVMGHPSSDIDIATEATPAQIIELFPKTILVGLSFGVVVVVFKKFQFEVSTFRKDLRYIDGRHPEQIEFSNAYEDAIRRDFTINGMFFDPLKNEVIDYVHGKEDMQKGLIRAIGNPYERFEEDRLRMIRAVRFAARFGFHIESETREAIIENASALFPAVSIERVWQELQKMSQNPGFDFAIIEMFRLGLLQEIFPRLKNTPLNEIKKLVGFYPNFPKNFPPIIYILELFPELPLADMNEIGKTLKISNQDLKLIEFFKNAETKTTKPLTPQEWVHLYADPLWEIYELFLEAHGGIEEHQKRKEQLKKFIYRVKEKKPVISAVFLKSHGIPQGIILGKLLQKGEQIAIEKDIEDPEQILNYLKDSREWPQDA